MQIGNIGLIIKFAIVIAKKSYIQSVDYARGGAILSKKLYQTTARKSKKTPNHGHPMYNFRP